MRLVKPNIITQYFFVDSMEGSETGHCAARQASDGIAMPYHSCSCRCCRSTVFIEWNWNTEYFCHNYIARTNISQIFIRYLLFVCNRCSAEFYTHISFHSLSVGHHLLESCHIELFQVLLPMIYSLLVPKIIWPNAHLMLYFTLSLYNIEKNNMWSFC